MTALQDPNGSCDVLTLDLTNLHTEGAEEFTSAVNVMSYVGIATLIMMARAIVIGSLAVKLQDSADGSTDWADVPGTSFVPVITISSSQRLAFNIGACRGWIRLSFTVTGASASYRVSVAALAKRS